MPDREDEFRDSFYYRAIRTRLGAALRAQFDLSQPLPDRIATLLAKLDNKPGSTPGEPADPARAKNIDRTGRGGA